MKVDTINNIIGNLREQLNLEAKWEVKKKAQVAVDGKLHVKFNGNAEEFIIEAKNEFRKQTLPQVFQLKELHPNLILLAGKIYPDVKKALQEQNINYIDGAGNMYVKTDKIFLFVEGRKENSDDQKFNGRLFEKTGLKILFALLNDDELINHTYREIALKTGVALGTVDYIMKELKAKGYILKVKREVVKLIKKNELLDRWVVGYDEKFKKNIFIGKFRIADRNWKEIHFNNNKTLWGGEPAAAILTKYLHPEIFTIYTQEDTTALAKNYRFIPDENGNVIINEKFWDDDYKVDRNVVPPMLVYADLVNTAVPRNIETAKVIYEKYLKNKFD